MADPSDVQLNILNTALEVANYVGFTGATAGASSEHTMRGSSYLLFGLSDTAQVAILGNASEQDYDAVIANWKIGDPPAAPTLPQLGAAKMF